MTDTLFRRLMLAIAFCGLAGAAVAQPLDPGLSPRAAANRGDFGCVVDLKSACQGRVDFEKGRNFEFKIGGPGMASIENLGNRRCTLEYTLTGSTLATAGRTMDIGPSGSMQVEVADSAGMILRFFNRGLGSASCDLSVTLKG